MFTLKFLLSVLAFVFFHLGIRLKYREVRHSLNAPDLRKEMIYFAISSMTLFTVGALSIFYPHQNPKVNAIFSVISFLGLFAFLLYWGCFWEVLILESRKTKKEVKKPEVVRFPLREIVSSILYEYPVTYDFFCYFFAESEEEAWEILGRLPCPM